MRTEKVIEYFGGVKPLADALGIWPQAIYRWGENVPELRAHQINLITKGELSLEIIKYEQH